MLSRRRFVITGTLGAAASFAMQLKPSGAATPALPVPEGPTVLTVTGKISATNSGSSAVFSMASLEGLGLTSFRTKTPWEPETLFTGVLLETLMATVKAHGTTVIAYALNDYSAELPINDFARYRTLLATRMNGQYMPVADKGPLFIIYPFDSEAALQSQSFYGRSVWQLDRLAIA